MRNSLKQLRRLADDLMDEQTFVTPFVGRNLYTGEVIDDQPKVDVLLNRIYRLCADYNEGVSLREDKKVNSVGSFPWYLERQANRSIRIACLKARSFCMLASLTPSERRRVSAP